MTTTKRKKKIDKDFCGTYTGWRKGCRCAPCVTARQEYRKQYKEEGRFGTGDEKLPIGPLVDYIGPECDREAIGEVLKVHKDTIRFWVANPKKMIDKYLANAYAMRLGVHPSLIWGKSWYSLPFFLNVEDRKTLMGE